MRAPALKPMQYLSLAGVLALTTAGGFVAYERFAPRPAAAARVTAVEVGRGTIASSVSASGSVAAPAQAKLTFKTGGRLTELLVNIGDQVKAGQVLARVDDADLQAALAQAQSGHNSAVAKLEQTQAGSRPEDIASAQAQVESAQIKLNQLRAVAGGPDAVSAQSGVEQARIKLNQLLAGGRAEDVAAGQAQLEAAQAKLAALQHPRAEDLAAAESQVEQARNKLEQLQHPRPEDNVSAESQLATARVKLQALLNPRPEDLAAAQSQLDQARTKMAQLQDQPATATPQDLANAELAVNSAQVAYDKALADAAANNPPAVGSAAAPRGSSAATAAEASRAGADAAVKQALINLNQAQNNLQKLKEQGPSEWDVRAQQLAVEQAKASLDKLKSPAPADVEAARAAVDQAQASLDKLKSPSPYDVQTAQEGLNQARIGLDKLKNPSPADIAGAQQAVISAQTGLDKLATPNDFDVRAAQQALLQAQASVDKLVSGNRYDILTAQSSLAQAQAALSLKLAGATAQELVIAQAAVDQAAGQLEQARANLAGTVLTAPYEGTVSALGGAVGEQVGSGVALVTLVDTRQVRVDVVVDETDIAKIQPGQVVNLTLEALPGQRIPGAVAVIAPVGTVTQGVVNYSVQIQVDPSRARGIRPGMTASAQIITESKEDVVSVPNRALRTQGRTRTVEVLDAEGKTAPRQVQTGLANDQMTEILSGVQPGDRVVIPATTAASANARVPGFGGPGPGPGQAVLIRP
ncbi:MAG TPA: efflux RND transporter periplasmic adaptor subunit [Chloroflexota bacterium]|nr:efflux RND transporter periplasmic adaptor subunit [Chloroflexota bacterium]